MTDHLPECFIEPNPLATECRVCDALRACEQRVLAEREADGPWFRSVVHDCCVDKQTAYAAGLDAAREAVVALPSWNYTYGGNPPMVEGPPQYGAWMVKAKALAAIDGVREEKAPPPLPPSVGVPIKPMWPLREEQK